MSRTKFIAAAAAVLTLTSVAGTQAQAGPRFGLGLGIATGLLVGAAIASNAYAQPAYGYRTCRLVREYDEFGNLRFVRVCNGY